MKPNTVPVSHIKQLGIHFAFKDEKLLPDCVMCDIVATPRRIRPQGTPMIVAKRVQVSACILGIVQTGLCDVSCTGQWVHHIDSVRDLLKVHFVFVPKTERDEFVAMKHDSVGCRCAFGQLAQTPWDVVVWRNGDGQFDISCTQPHSIKPQNVLFFDQHALRCTG